MYIGRGDAHLNTVLLSDEQHSTCRIGTTTKYGVLIHPTSIWDMKEMLLM